MATRATNFAAQVHFSGSASTLFTVPTGRVYLVRSVDITNSIGASTGRVELYRNGSAAGNLIYLQGGIVGTTTVLLSPWWVFKAGDTMQGKQNAGDFYVSVDGYDLPA